MRGALASFLTKGIRTATSKWTNKRNTNFTTWLIVIGFGIIALAVARNMNTRGIWNQMNQSIKNFRQQRFQAADNTLNTRNSLQNADQPSFFDGKAAQDIETLIDDSTYQKEVR